MENPILQDRRSQGTDDRPAQERLARVPLAPERPCPPTPAANPQGLGALARRLRLMPRPSRGPTLDLSRKATGTRRGAGVLTLKGGLVAAPSASSQPLQMTGGYLNG